jgi:DnaJ-domain-containing protein 1
MSNPSDKSGKPKIPLPPGAPAAVPKVNPMPTIALPDIKIPSVAPTTHRSLPKVSPSAVAPMVPVVVPTVGPVPSIPRIAPNASARKPKAVAPLSASQSELDSVEAAGEAHLPPFSSDSDFSIEVEDSQTTLSHHSFPFGRPPPFSGTESVENITPIQALQVEEIARVLSGMDYFVILGVPLSAKASEIKRSFHALSRAYHPDRFYHLSNLGLKDKLGTIYKRVTEAYFVLRDDATRGKYSNDIAGPERALKLRYTENSEAEQKAEARKLVVEEFGTNPKARPFFKSAVSDCDNQNFSAAERSLKMGLAYEPTNQRFKELLSEVQKKIEEQRRSQGGNFTIK